MSDGFFSDTHVTEAGLQGSIGPEARWWPILVQSGVQQFSVDSPMSLSAELGNRWSESIDRLRAQGQNFDTPTDPRAYGRFAQFVRDGTPVTADDNNPLDARYGTPHLSDQFEDMRRANEAIRQLNNPNIKTFEQILEEVSTMQRGVEEQTASMHERGPPGTWLAELLGGAAGSFTLRDPLNLVTAPIGAGRTIATRILTDMAIAGATTAITDLAVVQPNREFVGLPERNPYFDIGAAVLGAGLFRGGLEGLGHSAGRLRGIGDIEGIDFTVRDAQMQQMFERIDTPTARAASSILDDTIVFEHSNPYGEGQVAGYRWQAELEGTARALNGEAEVPLELPPIPSEYIDRHLSFQMVKETAPEVYARMEAAQAALRTINEPHPILAGEGPALSPNGLFREGQRHGNEVFLEYQSSPKEAPIPVHVKISDEGIAEISVDQFSALSNRIGPAKVREAMDELMEMYPEIRSFEGLRNSGAAPGRTQKVNATRRAANKEYQAAYRAVEAEAERLEHAEVAKRSIAQTQSIDVLGPSVTSEPMTGPMTRFDFVEAHAGKVEAADTAIPAKADAVNELEINPETNTVDIGTKTPISADFKVPFEDGELTVKEVLDDLAEDRRLEEAVKGCAI